MNNQEKYANVFVQVLGVAEDKLEDLEYQAIPEWDSVGHMELISSLESTFDIMMDTEDIIEFSSFKKGKEILTANYQISF